MITAPRPDGATARFTSLFQVLAAIGRTKEGWTRLAWTPEDASARQWFTGAAQARGLDVRRDRNGNLWAWWGDAEAPGAVATGSHLDTVPRGGAYDGALGVVTALCAVDLLRERGAAPRVPIAVATFADEEGARYDTPTFGSRLLTGALDPADALDRLDGQGVRMWDALTAAGVDPAGLGPDSALLQRLSAFVEVHVEQGRALAYVDKPLGLCPAIRPHGRWRLIVRGEANHAGTTRLEDRRDALLVASAAVAAARDLAVELGAVATVGKIAVEPNATNAVPGGAKLWLDARAPDMATVEKLVEGWTDAARSAAEEHGCTVDVTPESSSPGTVFPAELRGRLAAVLEREGLEHAEVDTGAGHDSGVLAARVPSALVFVRNPTGASHTPAERAEPDDCGVGVKALAAILEDLACR